MKQGSDSLSCTGRFWHATEGRENGASAEESYRNGVKLLESLYELQVADQEGWGYASHLEHKSRNPTRSL